MERLVFKSTLIENSEILTQYALEDILEEYSEKNTKGIGVPVAVGKFGIRLRKEIFTKKLSNDLTNNKIIKYGTLTIGMGSNQIDIGVLHKDATYCVSPAYTTYRINTSIIDPVFLEYLLMAKNSYLSHKYLIVGARQGKTIDKKAFLNQKLYIPNKTVQKKTGKFLSLIDKLIERHNQKVESIMKIRKGYKQKLIYRELRFVNNNGNNYPEWKKIKMDDIAIFYNGKAHEKIVNEKGQYVLINSKFVSTEGHIKKRVTNNLMPLYKNDIAIVMSDIPNGKALGKTYLVEENGKYTLNQRIGVIRVNENVIPEFFGFLLNRNPYFLKFDDGVQQTNLKKDDILNFSSNIPSSISEQYKISTMLKQLSTLINKVNMKIEALELFKKYYMQRLFKSLCD